MAALPAPPWPWDRFSLWNQRGKMCLHIGGHGGSSRNEVKTPRQFVGNQLRVSRSFNWKKYLKKFNYIIWPWTPMIAAGSTRFKVRTVLKPSGAQFVKPTPAYPQTISGRRRINLTGIEIV